MTPLPRVELQAEIGRSRAPLFELVSTVEGLQRWLDSVELDPKVGGAMRFGMGDATAVGSVVALTSPQHISYAWDWEGDRLGVPSVVAFDLIDHGHRTHMTVRHVGFPSAVQQRLHAELWRYWFERLVAASERLTEAQPT